MTHMNLLDTYTSQRACKVLGLTRDGLHQLVVRGKIRQITLADNEFPRYLRVDVEEQASRRQLTAVGVCLSQDSDVTTEAALRLMPPGTDLPRLDFNDPQVFGAYYDLWFQSFVRFVRSLTPLDDAAAEDIVQTAFMQVMQLDLPPLMWRQFRKWMRRKLLFAVLTYWRSQGRLRRWISVEMVGESEDGAIDHTIMLADSVPLVEEQMLIRERLCEVVQLCRQGRVSHQQLMRVLLEWGYDARQVAAYIEQHDVFGVPLAVVGDQLVRAEKPAFTCVQCGSTKHRHQGYGLCVNCYQRQLRQRRAQGQSVHQRRSAVTKPCTACGTTERRIHGHGLCEDCYRRVVRSQPQEGFQCEECGVTNRRQIAHGLCEPCYRRELKRLRSVMRQTNHHIAQVS